LLPTLSPKTAAECTPLTPLTAEELPGWLDAQPPSVRAWAAALGFQADSGQILPLADETGALTRVAAGIAGGLDDLWALAHLPAALPPGAYRLDPEPRRLCATRAAIGWALGSYRFERYRKADKPLAALRWPKNADRGAVERAAGAIELVRNLVNTPAADMGPAELADAARALAGEFEASFRVTIGADLLAAGYPAIHAVGRASPRVPRLIDLAWGNPEHPKVTLVGKGVCFDSGGLDLKPSSNMLLMKKDMGGAAHALAVARMVMMAGLPVRLRVLIPAVENVVSGNAFKPLDVLKTRKGLTVEVGNTDAEGRLILADALTEADAETPALLIDFATLTGAARVALGPEVPALFANDDRLAADLLAAAEAENDPLWRLPLWPGYRKSMDSKIADLSSTGSLGQAGAITAALFLERFVSTTTPWAHIDLLAWNPSAKPGRPEGGEAMTARAVYAMIEKRFGKR
jgi:leucyl aminopeptidase